jgi:hypothetical protein
MSIKLKGEAGSAKIKSSAVAGAGAISLPNVLPLVDSPSTSDPLPSYSSFVLYQGSPGNTTVPFNASAPEGTSWIVFNECGGGQTLTFVNSGAPNVTVALSHRVLMVRSGGSNVLLYSFT